MRHRKVASLKRWHNGDTPLRASELARVFLHSSALPTPLIARGTAALSASVPDSKRLLDLPPTVFGDEVEYMQWAQFRALFAKSTDGGSEQDRRNTALAAFRAAEEACSRANRRLRWYWSHPDREDPLTRVILSRARALIRDVLGDFSPAVLGRILDLSRPGSGVAIGTVNRDLVTGPFKLGYTELTVSAGALPYARLLVEESESWINAWRQRYSAPESGLELVYQICNANRIAFVPKDRSTLRTIAVEPALNMWLQLGVHEYLIPRLAAVGVHLENQSYNQRAARKGAAQWLSADPLCTMDLSAASDSVSVGLVERLLPPTWVDFLGDLRSTSYELEGATYEYQKWSSMGNGYTFALESLIFWAIGRACLTVVNCNAELHVYGDDIVLPRSAFLLMRQILAYCGFKLNVSKSFAFGPFRESCGVDCFGSQLVTPVYIRGREYLRPTDLYKVVNGLRRRGLHTPEVESACKKAHRGRPIVYGLCVTDDTEAWENPVAAREGYLRKNPDFQCFEQRVAVYTPDVFGYEQLWAYASSLVGGRNTVGDDWLVRAPELRKGRWSLRWRSRG